LAWVAACDYVNWLNLSPIDLSDVTKIRHTWEVMLEHLTCGRFNFAIPREVTTDSQVKTAVAREQAPNASHFFALARGIREMSASRTEMKEPRGD
jgi:hypothetical protein